MTRLLAQYVDPLDQIWISALAELQFDVQRDASAYASYDGKGTITIASPEFLDSDDCLAQLLLHELCHALVQGESSMDLPDWGLSDYSEAEGIIREHACQRTQAALLRPYGLDRLLAPTTEFRTYYDALPENPLLHSAADPAIPLAQTAMGRAQQAPYARVLREALQKTATLHQWMKGIAFPKPRPTKDQRSSMEAEEASWSTGRVGLPSIWQAVPPPEFHASGFPLSQDSPAKTCGDCAWFSPTHPSCNRSQLTTKPNISPSMTACVLFEPQLDCQACGACCKEAYDIVPIRRKEDILTYAPQWTVKHNRSWQMKRDQKKIGSVQLWRFSPNPPKNIRAKSMKCDPLLVESSNQAALPV